MPLNKVRLGKGVGAVSLGGLGHLAVRFYKEIDYNDIVREGSPRMIFHFFESINPR